jgi:two-component system copper resistance phosphate regulon response regulator CusR
MADARSLPVRRLTAPERPSETPRANVAPRVLIVEDDRKVAQALREGLVHEGFDATVESSGEGAFYRLDEETYDVVLLDLGLPGRDGLQILRRLRGRGLNTPVLILTARDAVSDRVLGLDSGADDYLVKPFAFSELAARIRAITRREGGLREPVIDTRGLELDPNTNRAKREGQDIHLTPKEFALVYYLARNEGRAVPQEELLEHIWDEHANPFTQTVKVHMNNLRRKLNEGFDDQLIETIRGKGYVL